MYEHSVKHHNGAKVEFKVKILGTCVGDPLLRQCMEAVAIRDEKPTLNGREEWGTNKANVPTIQLSVPMCNRVANKNDEIKSTAPPRKPDPDEKRDQSNGEIVCWKCQLICRTERGLKIHQHACLKKVTGGISFFRDERFDLNRLNRRTADT